VDATRSEAPAELADAAIARLGPREIALSGCWTASGMAAVSRLPALADNNAAPLAIDAGRIELFDTAGAWVLARLLQQLNEQGVAFELRKLPDRYAALLAAAGQHMADTARPKKAGPRSSQNPSPAIARLERLGRVAGEAVEQALALLRFIGETAVALAHSLATPGTLRWRPMLYNIRSAGFDALPIVGLLSFLLGVVVAYQGADQLRQYGANIFVADLVGLSMLREFAPLITAIIVAGRSGSAFTAQIGTMSVNEEIDAMLTLGISPLDMLVLPKLLALLVALPLLTVFADLLGVIGGMLMAQTQLGVSIDEFGERFVKAVSVTAYLVGIAKAPVFALIIVMVGCFQGFRTRGGADSVGRQTTRSVVQSIFLVIVGDALFSVAFSALDL
jgi:phospholipid/cholesterol/gamma-HCH transport system permease protein